MENNVKENFYKKLDGPTPNGGKYTILYFYDRNGEKTTEKNAVNINAIEYDEEDNVLRTTYLVKAKNEKRTGNS